ncbi:aldose 1-epimerase family protein [Cellulomonas composti]|uniref:aldose 1-epimerase family protein n=1 Tax=Cellulomonas composti TaxID=266130 RepID=UPI001FEA20AC|nr:aldose 1-epimerase family protein [Cellulomonas composti]
MNSTPESTLSAPTTTRAAQRAGDDLPTGAQVEIALGDQHAWVAAVGASLRAYTVGGRDVVLPFDEGALAPAFSGAVLAPWPNRLGEGAYDFAGVHHEVALTERERRTALHGLVSFARFEVVAADASSVTLAHTIVPTPGYPWPVRIEVSYALGDGGLVVTTTATNLGASAAPYGVGFHPWLSPGGGAVDECTLQVGVTRHVTVDDRLLPTGDEEPAGPYDLAEPLSLRGVQLDDAWLAPVLDDEGRSWARFSAPDGRTVAMWADETFTAWQVCTGDGIPRIERRGVAVEPMTCIADAFRTGDLLITLEPATTHRCVWGLRLE